MVSGTNSANKNMKLEVRELEVNGQAFGGSPADAISDISVTGTYADDDDAIEAAVNGILAALRSNGIIASS